MALGVYGLGVYIGLSGLGVRGLVHGVQCQGLQRLGKASLELWTCTRSEHYPYSNRGYMKPNNPNGPPKYLNSWVSWFRIVVV